MSQHIQSAEPCGMVTLCSSVKANNRRGTPWRMRLSPHKHETALTGLATWLYVETGHSSSASGAPGWTGVAVRPGSCAHASLHSCDLHGSSPRAFLPSHRQCLSCARPTGRGSAKLSPHQVPNRGQRKSDALTGAPRGKESASPLRLPTQTLLPPKRLGGRAPLCLLPGVPRILSAAFSSDPPYSPSSSLPFLHTFVDRSAEAWKALLLPWQL